MPIFRSCNTWVNKVHACSGVTAWLLCKVMFPITRASTNTCRPVMAAKLRATTAISVLTNDNHICPSRPADGAPAPPGGNARAGGSGVA